MEWNETVDLNGGMGLKVLNNTDVRSLTSRSSL